jgi:integral membrane protein
VRETLTRYGVIAPLTRGALTRYRVMAYVVGTMLIILVCIGVPLRYAANEPGLVSIVGPLHGFLYIVYLVVAFDLARRGRFNLLELAAMVLSGLVPTLAFIVERRITRRAEERMAGEQAGVSSG